MTAYELNFFFLSAEEDALKILNAAMPLLIIVRVGNIYFEDFACIDCSSKAIYVPNTTLLNRQLA